MSKYLSINEIENAVDSLEHTVASLERKDRLKWKWVALALHHALYSFCICALEQGNYESVISEGTDDAPHYFRRSPHERWRKSRRVSRNGGPGYTIEWEWTDEEPPTKSGKPVNKLISIWTALARVQDAAFWMSRTAVSKAVQINDDEWRRVQWLILQVRNDLVHFVPKSLLVSIADVRAASQDIVKIIGFLVFESNVIINWGENGRDQVELALKRFGELIDA